MNLIVTGGEGFIGSKIVILAGASTYDLKSGKDILNTKQLSDACENVDGIFHCAAKITVSESIQKPDEYYLHNVQGTASVIAVAEEKKRKIVFSSSAAVYGESSHPVREDHVLNPQSPYAENKRDGEALLKQSSIPSVILRYFNVYGPGQSPAYAGVITAFIQAALKGNDLVIHGDGEQVRDFVYVDDVARANILAMETELKYGEVFNIATGTRTSITELATAVLRITHSSSKILYAPARPGDITYSQAETAKAKQLLGWEAQVGLEEGLERTIKSFC